jgi:hypothetical protein
MMATHVTNSDCVSHLTFTSRQSEICITTDGQTTSLSWCQDTIWGTWWSVLSFFHETLFRQFVVMGSPLWRDDGSVVYSCCWAPPAQSFLALSSAGLMSKFQCLKFVTPPTGRTRSLYLYPRWKGWPSYTHGHWVPFSLPLTIRRATVEVF